MVLSDSAFSAERKSFSEGGILRVRDYVIQSLAVLPPVPDHPDLPDISGYTLENLQRRKPEPKAGKIEIRPMLGTLGLRKFTEPERLKEFGDLQGRKEPRAVHILSGVYTIDTLLEAIGDPSILSRSKDGRTYTLSLPIYIDANASLIIEGTDEKDGKKVEVQFLQDTGAFIVSAGNLFAINVRMSGWNRKKGAYAAFENKKVFRPFFLFWSGSKSYIGASIITHMGYSSSKSYGVSFSASTAMKKLNPKIPRPTGWVIDSHFEDMYYGFYSYEADDVAIIRNVYANNIIYGIDPHDRSRRLIIARNHAYGTKKKHGIIVSREVNDGWIFYNNSHDNHGAGIMIDRTSVNNVIAYNVSTHNGTDGLTVFESEKNTLWGNVLTKNGKHGLRIRNSWDVFSYYDVIAQNGGSGVHLYTSDITGQETRDFAMDPFTKRASLLMHGAFVGSNGSSAFKFETPEYVRLSKMEVTFPGKTFGRDLRSIKGSLAQTLFPKEGGIEIRRIPRAKKAKSP